MDRIKLFFKTDSLKRSFIFSVFSMVALVALLSVASILACIAVQNWLVPVRDEAMLNLRYEDASGAVLQDTSSKVRTNGVWAQLPLNIFFVDDDTTMDKILPMPTAYSLELISSPALLSPKRRLLYDAMSICTVMLPMLYSLLGIILCALQFHKKKLAQPLAVLMNGAGRIADNDLDFTIDYTNGDEMGMLCSAFEKMRTALLESQRTTWALMDERKQLNASIAHDIRTPITIIEGYTEYLQRNLKSGKADEETIARTLKNLSESAVRLEKYVDSVRDIQNMDDIPVYRVAVELKTTVREMAEDMAVLCAQAKKNFLCDSESLPDISALLDKQILSRIMENLVANACRYAKEQVELSFCVQNGFLSVRVQDDGAGFSAEALARGATAFFKESASKEHAGLGAPSAKHCAESTQES